MKGRRLKLLKAVNVTSCEGKQVNLPVENPNATEFVVKLPASLIVKPCVLHIESFALGVANPQLARLKSPSGAPPEALSWGGSFDHVSNFHTEIPPNGSVLSVSVRDPKRAYDFVLGKGDTPLFRVDPLGPAVQNVTGKKRTIELDLFLPGVFTTDVQWRGDDEVFWVGVLSDDGSEVNHRELLSSMADEPSGPVDQD